MGRNITGHWFRAGRRGDWYTADHKPPREILEACGCLPLANKLVWEYFTEPGTLWSRAARARERKRRLRKRLERKYPMFADQFYEQDLAARPLYFEGRHPVWDAGRPGGPSAEK